MRAFIRNVILFTLLMCLIVTTTFLTVPRKYYEIKYYSLWQEIYSWPEQFASNTGSSNKSANIVIGDSRAQIGLNSNNLNSINLAIVGSTPVEGYYQIQEILSNIEIDTLYLSYGYFHLYTQDCFVSHTIRYNTISDQSVNEVFSTALAVDDPNYTMENPVIRPRFKFLWNCTKNIKITRFCINYYDFISFNLSKILKYDADDQAATQFVSGHYLLENRYFNYDYDENRTPEFTTSQYRLPISKINQIYLEKILSLCHYEKIIPYFILMPLPDSSTIPDVMYFDNCINNLQQMFGNKLIVDELFYPNSCFRDVSHLNNEGAQIFSAEIQRLIYMGSQIQTNSIPRAH